MALNNPGLYNAALAGAATAFCSRWILGASNSAQVNAANAAIALATEIDSKIPTAIISIANQSLMESIVSAIVGNRLPSSPTSSDYSSIAQAIADVYNVFNIGVQPNPISGQLFPAGGESSIGPIDIADGAGLVTLASSPTNIGESPNILLLVGNAVGTAKGTNTGAVTGSLVIEIGGAPVSIEGGLTLPSPPARGVITPAVVGILQGVPAGSYTLELKARCVADVPGDVWSISQARLDSVGVNTIL
jgi:hypothetical protein